jgi:hypothetical protein
MTSEDYSHITKLTGKGDYAAWLSDLTAQAMAKGIHDAFTGVETDSVKRQKATGLILMTIGDKSIQR